jgi:hypothetical protein
MFCGDLPKSCPALCRASTSLMAQQFEDVGGWDEPGHDG